jgi:hypothetical protein
MEAITFALSLDLKVRHCHIKFETDAKKCKIILSCEKQKYYRLHMGI